MKSSKRMIALFAAVLAFAMLVPGVLAASGTSAEAGKTASVTFTFQDVYNVDGTFTVSDPQKILSTYSIQVEDDGATAALVSGDRLWASPDGEPVRTTVSVSVSMRIKSTAAAGSRCTVTFNGIYGDANERVGNEVDITRTATVTVKAAEGAVAPTVTPAVTPSPGPTTAPTVTPTPSTSPAPTAQPQPSADPTPAVTPSTGSAVDYSALGKQISIAGGLILSDYTDESQTLLASALETAQNALNSDDQAVVTAAAEELRAAIAGLKRMDYSGLKAALAQADAFLNSEEAALSWQQLSQAVEQGEQLLQSSDQQAVDQAAQELSDSLAGIAALLEADTETKVVVQEVPVEVPPAGEYCNIPAHHVRSVLLWVSVALNVILLGGIAAFLIGRTRNRKDHTPLVDYDIDEDF